MLSPLPSSTGVGEEWCLLAENGIQPVEVQIRQRQAKGLSLSTQSWRRLKNEVTLDEKKQTVCIADVVLAVSLTFLRHLLSRPVDVYTRTDTGTALPAHLAERYHRADVLQKVLELPLKQLWFNPRDLLTAEGHALASSPLAPPSGQLPRLALTLFSFRLPCI